MTKIISDAGAQYFLCKGLRRITDDSFVCSELAI